MELSEDLLCLFSAQVKERGGSYIIELPQREITVGDVEADSVYRVAVLSQATPSSIAEPEPAPEQEHGEVEPPVEEGEVLDVEIEDIGDQGDGIARVGPGYVIITPDTERGERAAVKMTEVRENMAFAEVVERYDRIE